MSLLIVILLVAAAVTANHANSLRRAQRLREAPTDTRLRLWKRHAWQNGALWLLLFLLIALAEFFFSKKLTPRPLPGVCLTVIGLILVIWSRYILGRAGAMGIRWFVPEKISAWETRGPYRFLTNPMYDGFILIFIGLGLWFGTTENFVLALASFLFLNLFLNKVESAGRPYRIF